MIFQLANNIFTLIFNNLFGYYFLAGFNFAAFRQMVILNHTYLTNKLFAGSTVEVETLSSMLSTIPLVISTVFLFFYVCIKPFYYAVIDWKCFFDGLLCFKLVLNFVKRALNTLVFSIPPSSSMTTNTSSRSLNHLL